MSEHRLDPLRLNPLYKQADDVRRQLRFMESVERETYERHQRESQEHDAQLLRFTLASSSTTSSTKGGGKAAGGAASSRENHSDAKTKLMVGVWKANSI